MIHSTKCEVCVYTPGSPGRPHSIGPEVQLAMPTLSPPRTRGPPRSPVHASLPPSESSWVIITCQCVVITWQTTRANHRGQEGVGTEIDTLDEVLMKNTKRKYSVF